MIFLTVGSALPFDRLISLVDEAVQRGALQVPVFAQVGNGSYLPTSFEYVRFLSKPDYQNRISDSQAVISHAGIGTITTALACSLPLIAMPRSPRHSEIVDDHQEKTADAFATLGHILVFRNSAELDLRLRELGSFKPRPRRPNTAGVAAAIGEFLVEKSPAYSTRQSEKQKLTG